VSAGSGRHHYIGVAGEGCEPESGGDHRRRVVAESRHRHPADIDIAKLNPARRVSRHRQRKFLSIHCVGEIVNHRLHPAEDGGVIDDEDS